MLMEMDEIITQIRNWRTALSLPPQPSIAETDQTGEGYTSAAYDRVFGSDTSPREGPESDEGHYEPAASHIADIDMAAKVRST
jgi:hypothetical protein